MIGEEGTHDRRGRHTVQERKTLKDWRGRHAGIGAKEYRGYNGGAERNDGTTISIDIAHCHEMILTVASSEQRA